MLNEMGPPQSESWNFDLPDSSWSLELDEFLSDVTNGTDRSNNVSSSLFVLKLVEEIYERTGR
jgi:hypothetical protein